MRDTLGTAEQGAWSGGILKAVDASLVPSKASPRGYNTALALAQTGVPYLQKRMGMSCLTATPLTDSEAILGQHDYVEASTGTRRHLCTTETKVAVKASAGTFSTLSVTLTSDTPPSFTTANNMAFLFNGTDAYKVRGTTVENVGIVRPVVGSMAGAAGGALVNVTASGSNAAGDLTALTAVATLKDTAKVGTFTNAYTDTQSLNATSHICTGTATDFDVAYQFETGANINPIGLVWKGYLQSSDDTATFMAWNHVTAAWEAITTITAGDAGTVVITKTVALTASHRGTSVAELGKVYIRIGGGIPIGTNGSNPVLGTDHMYLTYGSHNGTYELRVAYQNSNTGHISSASDTATDTIAVVNDTIDWTDIPVSPDAQVDTRLLLVRNTATMAKFYVAKTISDNSTTTANTSILDTNLVTLAPTRTSRNPPVDGITVCTTYRGRLVVSEGEAIYWSRIDEPEAFDTFAYDFIDSSGDPITGLVVNQNALLILKDDRTFAITGDLGGAYTLTLLDADVGCLAHKTIVSADGSVFWWSRYGIVRYANGQIDRIGMRTYGDPNDRVNVSTISVASAVAHEVRGTIYFALPDTGQTRATFLLPFNYVLGVLESERWDPMDCASLGKALDSSGVLQPTLGNYAGQVFQLWSTNNDGVLASTSTGGTFTASSSNIVSASFVDANGLSIDIAGGGLLERKVTILDSDGEIVTGLIRPRITSSPTAGPAANVVGFDLPVTVTSGDTYTIVIGGPDFQFDTPWRNFGDEWIKKRFEYLFLLLKGADYGSAATVTMSFDYDDINLDEKDRTFTSAIAGAGWDVAVWDTDVWDASQTVERRYRVARTGRSWRARLKNPYADQPVALLLIAAQAVGQTVKR